jgi:MFS family permease
LVSKQVSAVLTILGGVFYIIGALVGGIALAGFLFGLFGSFTSITSSISSSLPASTPTLNFGALGTGILLIIIFGIFTGAMIIVGGALLNSDSAGRRKSGGILAVAMMILGGLPTLGGLFIGFILTLVGAVLGLTYKESSPDIMVGYQPAAAAPEALTPPPAATVGALRFCIKCGSPLYEGAAFCGVCGAPVPRS